MSFGSDLSRFAKRAQQDVTNVKRAVALELFSAIVLATPVGNPRIWKGKASKDYVGGRLRANWNFSLNKFDTKTTTNTDKSGAVTLNFLLNTIQAADYEDAICMTNSLPYAHSIEYDGHSSQMPRGMVRTNVVRFRKILRSSLRKKEFKLQ